MSIEVQLISICYWLLKTGSNGTDSTGIKSVPSNPFKTGKFRPLKPHFIADRRYRLFFLVSLTDQVLRGEKSCSSILPTLKEYPEIRRKRYREAPFMKVENIIGLGVFQSPEVRNFSVRCLPTIFPSESVSTYST